MVQLLGNIAIGSIVKLKEKGTPQNYIVVHQGLPSSLYDSSCNGTWLLRQNILKEQQWNEALNTYASSTIQNELHDIANNVIDSDIGAKIKTIKIPYCVGNASSEVNSGANGLSCKVFLLSGYEVGWTTSDYFYFPVDGAKLSYFEAGTESSANNKRIAKLNGDNTYWWLRSPVTSEGDIVWYVLPNGDCHKRWNVRSSLGVRPAMIMPTDLLVDDSNNIVLFPTIAKLTAPSTAMQGQPIPLSWTPVSISGFDITYQLQRNADNGGWTTIYTGSNTSYTDTAGAWTQVQYQVAAVIEGFTGDYTQSSIIPVSDPSALVISGSDGNLGTLTSNVPYTVSSNTGNPISLTRTVNDAQVVTLTVDSGFAYNIPIADLPTGTGTIQITASVERSSETVTQTRTWTYYKTPINIPSTGGIAQLTQNGQNIWPVTVPDAVEAPVYLGGNLNAALNKLGQAALYTKIGSPKYNQVTVDLSKVKVGDEVLLPENGVMVPHIVVHIGNPDDSMYDASCNGVWLLRKDCIENGQWNSTNVNTLAGSTIMTTMQGYVTNYGTEVQSAIKTVKIPYITGNQNTTLNNLSNGLECQLFPLSVIECGIKVNQPSGIYSDGAKLSYFLSGTSSNADAKRISNTNWWTRSIFTTSPIYVELFYANGAWDRAVGEDNYAKAQNGIRPAFIMPTTFNQTYYVDSSNNIHPAQEYTTGGSITDVFGYDVPICQYETGSYVGTGTYGQSNPTSLTFNFKPKFIIVFSLSETSTYPLGGFPWGYGVPNGFTYLSTNNVRVVKISWSNNTVSWYNDAGDARVQLNGLNSNYTYIAIG